MRYISLFSILLLSSSAKSQKIFVKETEYNLETIIKQALIANKDSVTELESKGDYILKIIVETRGAMERGTVKAVLIRATSGTIIYETIPEKVTSHYGVPTSSGIKHGLNHIAEEKTKEISLTVENDYLKNH